MTDGMTPDADSSSSGSEVNESISSERQVEHEHTCIALDPLRLDNATSAHGQFKCTRVGNSICTCLRGILVRSAGGSSLACATGDQVASCLTYRKAEYSRRRKSVSASLLAPKEDAINRSFSPPLGCVSSECIFGRNTRPYEHVRLVVEWSVDDHNLQILRR
jgi:hypothetical protein